MKILLFLSDATIPLLIFSIVGYGLLNHHNVYDDFIKGAKDGFQTVIGIMPTLIGLMVGVGILRASGFLDFLATGLGIITEPLHFPAELVPVSIVKMFSSSAATGLVLDIFKEYGPDSYFGTITSIMMSCTETIFYTMSVYFMTAKVQKTRYTLAGALFATLIGTIASVILAQFMIY
ncbi:MAG: spore maturation protein [Lachnospiraceae bacterium]|nr:spore maturation protein [Lachnospiraceae bacterium]